MESGPLCALLWRILTWCTRLQVTLKARHIPGHLNVIADKLSRLGQTNLLMQPFNQTLHRNLLNPNLHAWLLEPQLSKTRASLRQWQHEMRLLKEDQPDQSKRQSGPFLKWCLSNKVDFRAPPLKDIADFLLYLFQDRKLQLGTIDGYMAKMKISPVS